jgi:hypothetical protein
MHSVAELKDSFTLKVKFALEQTTKAQMENGGINPLFLSISALHGSGWSTLCFGRLTSLKEIRYPFYSLTLCDRVINVATLINFVINVATHVRGLLIRFVHRSAGCLNVIAVVQRRSLSLETSSSDTNTFFCLLNMW